MKFVIAPQPFKGSLTAVEAAAAMARGVRTAAPGAEIIELPIADGGAGTVRAIAAAAGGEIIETAVSGPLGKPVTAAWARLPDGTAVIEMAAASGLALAGDPRQPLDASTCGTGELIKAALDAGCRKFIVGLGDSATTDGGAGMAAALGARFLDAAGNEIPRGGAGLEPLDRIDSSNLDERLKAVTVQAACDVTNPLYGPEGAAYIYGPQKGATPDDVKRLDAALRRYAAIVKRDVGTDISKISGGGAAGGLGAGLAAFLHAELKSGIDLVADATGLEDHLKGAGLVLTGEGSIDSQTSRGKTVAGITRRAKAVGVPVIALAGQLGTGYEELFRLGVRQVVGCKTPDMADAEAMRNAAALLEQATTWVVGDFLRG
jgi:glycerate kinase